MIDPFTGLPTENKAVTDPNTLLKDDKFLLALRKILNIPVSTYGGVTVDTDSNMTANSDSVVPSQKAVKTYIASHSSGGTWGSITGTLSNQTDLQTALDAKLSQSQVMARTSIGF